MTNLINDWGDSSTELDFENHWSSLNVQQEVLRGVELRERKPKTNKVDYDFVDISLPSCSKCPDRTFSRRYKTRKVTKKTRLKQYSKDRICPLRVVELAEPSKRHCLNTWKNNFKTLPDYMVERLRRHVMDEEPVVRISEAVHYFKKRKKLSKKRSNTNCKPRSKNIRKFNIMISSIFGYKIMQKLIPPVNIILNEELTNINHVVNNEISKILRNKNKYGNNTYNNDKILYEMAKKVTVWITNILEETSYKQLLEQLEEMEEEEGPVLDILDEILNSVKIPGSSDSNLSKDSDTIISLSTKNTEDVIESALGAISEDTNYSKGSDNAMYLDKDEILSADGENSHDSVKIIAMNKTLGIEEEVKSLLEERINYIADNIGNTDDNDIIDTGKKMDLISDSKIENSVYDFNQTSNNKNNLASSTDHDNVDTEDNDMVSSTQKSISEPDKIIDLTLNGSKDTPEEDMDQQNDIKLHIDAIVDDEINTLSIGDLDEETKKVKFSNINMGTEDDRTHINKYSSEFMHDKEPVVWKSSKDYILSHFNVAPPNPHLLSYIDEVWPEYFLPPLLKATESVNKSVTSLGRIMETDDENIIYSPNYKLPRKKIEKIFNKQLNTAILNLTDEGVSVKTDENKEVDKTGNNIYSNKNFVKNWQENYYTTVEQSSKHFPTDEDATIKVHKHEDLQVSKTKVSNKEIAQDGQQDIDPQSSLNKHYMKDVHISEIPPSHDTGHIWKQQTLQDCGDVKSIKSNKSIVLEVKHTSKDTPKPLVNKTPVTVNKKVQTSFVTNINNDTFSIDNNEIIRKWCKGLQNVTENLELWATWIQNVCLNVTYLKYEGMSSKSGTFQSKHMRKLIKLKHNIDVDVQQWSQLRSRLCRGLQSYKHSYHTARKDTSIPPNKNNCRCIKNVQNSLCSQIVFENYYRTIKRV